MSSLNLIPDLSLHISPPNSAPSSICTGNNEGDSCFVIWRSKDEDGLKSHSDSSVMELCLANNNLSSSSAFEAESPAGLGLGQQTSFVAATAAATTTEDDQIIIRQRNLLKYANGSNSSGQQQHQLSNLNHGISVLDVTGLKPIKGIPIYNNMPFSSLDNFVEMDPNKLRFYSSPAAVVLHSGEAYRIANIGAAASARFNGISMETLRPQQFHHYSAAAAAMGSNSDLCNGYGMNMIRSRFLPKLQSKRKMRAPIMRWTSSLHARFVHVVELLGGHEILELMDVKDLTLAHVKSHLQMCRTVKSTDKPTASSDGSGEEDYLPARNTISQNGSPNPSIQNENGYPSSNLWSNSSR
ncbi:hypothetical protein COLO4_20581 [Corchorus olitorius]|uniref:Myb-like domain-containing protein n=1 Tax=Corchorus olitorius TaxID=93759 RepID=A0A1R3IYX3_9ROSI|nr:hypothetical protein COLO4_20581 [Corchorus olitorius]